VLSRNQPKRQKPGMLAACQALLAAGQRLYLARAPRLASEKRERAASGPYRTHHARPAQSLTERRAAARAQMMKPRRATPKDLLGDHPVASLFLPNSYTRADGVDIFDGVPRWARIWSFVVGLIITGIAVAVGDTYLVVWGQCHYLRGSDEYCALMAEGIWDCSGEGEEGQWPQSWPGRLESPIDLRETALSTLSPMRSSLYETIGKREAPLSIYCRAHGAPEGSDYTLCTPAELRSLYGENNGGQPPDARYGYCKVNAAGRSYYGCYQEPGHQEPTDPWVVECPPGTIPGQNSLCSYTYGVQPSEEDFFQRRSSRGRYQERCVDAIYGRGFDRVFTNIPFPNEELADAPAPSANKPCVCQAWTLADRDHYGESVDASDKGCRGEAIKNAWHPLKYTPSTCSAAKSYKMVTPCKRVWDDGSDTTVPKDPSVESSCFYGQGSITYAPWYGSTFALYGDEVSDCNCDPTKGRVHGCFDPNSDGGQDGDSGRADGAQFTCDEDGGDVHSSVGLYLKRTVFASLFTRLFTFVSGQQAIKWACVRYSSALGGGPFPKPLMIGLAVWGLIGTGYCLLLSMPIITGPLTQRLKPNYEATEYEKSIHSNLFTQLMTEWLVLEWLETIATCAIGLHDTKLKIDMDRDTAGADGEGGEESETVENPTAAKDDKKEKEKEKEKKKKKKKEKKTAE
jgi:hypothetical protein